MNRLRQALDRTNPREDSVAVLFLDLDGFKHVNDSLGHEAGDQLLVSVAGRLARCMRLGDTLSRFGGDEFVVLLEDIARTDEAIQIAERIAEELQVPFEISGEEVSVTASLGIARSFTVHDRPESLLRDADAAMYMAKAKGKARHELFGPSMKHRALERLRLGNDLRRALKRGEFVVHYQPQVRVENGEIVGVEALARWEHPERGLVYPMEFIPFAEEAGLIAPIGKRVLEEACRQASRWKNRYPSDPPLGMCVNLSARQFNQPELAGEVAEVLRETGLEPGGLTLEITESVLMDDARSSTDTLHELKALGVRIGVDDFGTGYSSLSYLKRFPVDYLKVDRSFVAGLGRDLEDTGIVSAMIDLSHTLGLEAVAEGVETEEQLAKLQEMGCSFAQGFLFSKPLPSKAADTLLVRRLANELDAGWSRSYG